MRLPIASTFVVFVLFPINVEAEQGAAATEHGATDPFLAALVYHAGEGRALLTFDHDCSRSRWVMYLAAGTDIDFVVIDPILVTAIVVIVAVGPRLGSCILGLESRVMQQPTGLHSVSLRPTTATLFPGSRPPRCGVPILGRGCNLPIGSITTLSPWPEEALAPASRKTSTGILLAIPLALTDGGNSITIAWVISLRRTSAAGGGATGTRRAGRATAAAAAAGGGGGGTAQTGNSLQRLLDHVVHCKGTDHSSLITTGLELGIVASTVVSLANLLRQLRDSPAGILLDQIGIDDGRGPAATGLLDRNVMGPIISQSDDILSLDAVGEGAGDGVVPGNVRHLHGVEGVHVDWNVEKELDDTKFNMTGPVVRRFDGGGIRLDFTVELLGEEWPEMVGVGSNGLSHVLTDVGSILVSAMTEHIEALLHGVGLAETVGRNIDNFQLEGTKEEKTGLDGGGSR